MEEELVESISTTHGQTIHIQLKNGREYRGKYIYDQAGKYSRNDKLWDILNLVMHIQKNRPPEEVNGWRIGCE